MVWGCITRHGVGELHRIEGIMDRFGYTDILSESLLGTLDKHNLDRSTVYFQHDGDSKHQSKHAKGWLELEGFDVLPWCPNSPDMNIIENLWDHLDRMVRARNPLPKNKEELWLALKEEWDNIDQQFIDRLYDSLPNRVRDLLKANGGETRY
jgi:transposase